MMNILVTGSNGQLGRSIKSNISHFPSYHFIFTDIDELDITQKDKIESFINKNNIQIVINCAAYTAVDKAEEEKEKAEAINTNAVGYLAEICKKKNILLVHTSTDYIFDGNKKEPYIETDIPNPLGFYGKTKYEGEQALLKINPKALIIRTSWLYSEYGHNFVKTILGFIKNHHELKVVDDQQGTPTYATDLAKVILQIIPKYNDQSTQTYHYSNEGNASWCKFAEEIAKLSGEKCEIKPVSTEDYSKSLNKSIIAKRPAYSVLDTTNIKKDFHIKIPNWKDSLKICLNHLKETRS